MSFLIEGFTAGDDLQIERDIPGVDPADPIVKAWLTIKAKLSDADPGALQKIITPAAVANVGQITLDGAESNGDGTATCVFQLTGAQTAALGTAIRYYYDIQAKSNLGKIYTSQDPETGEVVGRLQLLKGVTDATS